jgi:hypothetical protein
MDKNLVVAAEKDDTSKPEWPKTVILTRPVMAHDKEYTELVFKEPNGGHLMSLPTQIEGGADSGTITLPTLELASLLADVPTHTIKSLCLKDSLEVMKIINPLAVDCLTTMGAL